jgi:hypothetical protein
MDVYLHGGKCCGIKHIFGLGHSPNYTLPRKAPSKVLKNEASCYFNSTKNFFWRAAPAETYLQRLDRILSFLDEVRPQGVCEIVLAATQLLPWQQILLDRGFVRVTECKNSNSGGKIYIFHRAKE